jgi:ribosome-binding ATPase YchF (GTP1/OBG family)
MKTAVFGLESFKLGKEGVPDDRLTRLTEMFKSKKETPVQVEFISSQNIKDAEVILSQEDKKADLILSDLEYAQDRLTKEIPQSEKELFLKAQQILEKEDFLSKHLSKEELKILKGFPLLTVLPMYLIKSEEDFDPEKDLKAIYYASGRICFFTAGEKESRSWSIHNGQTALEAAGCIHSDIQQGFVRAEVVSLEDLFASGHYNQAKNEGKIRLEEKDYIVKDGEYIIFRANK